MTRREQIEKAAKEICKTYDGPVYSFVTGAEWSDNNFDHDTAERACNFIVAGYKDVISKLEADVDEAKLIIEELIKIIETSSSSYYLGDGAGDNARHWLNKFQFKKYGIKLGKKLGKTSKDPA